MESIDQHTTVEYIILGDYVEATAFNRLNIIGGGWDHRLVLDFNQPVTFSAGVSILVPWIERNRPILLRATVRDADDTQIGDAIETTLLVSAAAHSFYGQALRQVLGVNFIVGLPKPGAYVIEVRLNEGEQAGEVLRTAFYADPMPVQQQMVRVG